LLLPFTGVRLADVGKVGGKNASLGELISSLTQEGVAVPPGFATTAFAYRQFLAENALAAPLSESLAAYRKGESSLRETGEAIRGRFLEADLPRALQTALVEAYRDLSRQAGREEASVAVRSSATAEDLADASFAGQQETFLNVVGEPALAWNGRHRRHASLLAEVIEERAKRRMGEGDIRIFPYSSHSHRIFLCRLAASEFSTCCMCCVFDLSQIVVHGFFLHAFGHAIEVVMVVARHREGVREICVEDIAP
jgi:hypothetical protein